MFGYRETTLLAYIGLLVTSTKMWPSFGEYTYNPSTWKTEARGSLVQGQPGPHRACPIKEKSQCTYLLIQKGVCNILLSGKSMTLYNLYNNPFVFTMFHSDFGSDYRNVRVDKTDETVLL